RIRRTTSGPSATAAVATVPSSSSSTLETPRMDSSTSTANVSPLPNTISPLVLKNTCDSVMVDDNNTDGTPIVQTLTGNITNTASRVRSSSKDSDSSSPCLVPQRNGSFSLREVCIILKYQY